MATTTKQRFEHGDTVRVARDFWRKLRGAAGYIPKVLSAQEMLAALKIVADGDVFVPPQAG